VATNIAWKKLLSTTADTLCVISCEEELVDDLVRTPPRRTIARTIRGHRCTTKTTTLQEWAAALQFPSSFGNNWDAFEDCVRDLDWLNARRVVVMITCADQMLPRSAKEFATLIDILRSAQKETPFLVVLHSKPENKSALRRRVAASLPSETR